MKRFADTIPGYDCIRHPCGKRGCGTNPGSSHGIASDMWVYAVSDGQAALSLRVSSDVYPESVPASGCSDLPPRGMVMHEHRAFPTSTVEVLSQPDKCQYLDAEACYPDEGSCCAADKFFRKFGGPRFEQPELFWQKLEEELRVRAVQLQADRVDQTLCRCPNCNGTGVVEKRPVTQLVAELDGLEQPGAVVQMSMAELATVVEAGFGASSKKRP